MTATADPPVELPPVVTASKNMAKDDPEHERALKLETENAELRKRLGQFVELRERVAVLERSQRDIAMLGKASLSPAALLIELGSILTPNKSPTIDEDTSRALQNDPTRQWNPKWDPKTIVLDHIVERRCHIALAGDAKSADDLAEFVKRLSASVHFDDVESSLTRGRRFHITGRAKF